MLKRFLESMFKNEIEEMVLKEASKIAQSRMLIKERPCPDVEKRIRNLWEKAERNRFRVIK